MTIPIMRAATERGEPAAATRPYALVYDGGCDVCRRLVGLVQRWDTRQLVELIPSDEPGLAGRFPWLAPPDYAEAMQLIGPGGETWAGAAAAERLLHLLPRGRLAGWIFRLPLGRHAAERGYRWFARNRHRFGCAAHCGATAGGRPARRSGISGQSPRGS